MGWGRDCGQACRGRALGVGASLVLLAAVGVGCGRGVVADGIPDPDTVPQWSAVSSTLLVTRGSAWRYLDDGSSQGTAWREPAFDDGAWKMGAAQLGYGDGDEKTIVGYGGNPNAKYITTYFRHSFTVTHPDLYGQLTLELLRDDGAVAYLNGVEVYRSNMPAGAIDYRTLAAANSPDEDKYFQVTLNAPTLILQGTNVLAVEVHQYSQWSSDVGFDASLSGEPATVPTPPPPPPPATASGVGSWMANYGFWPADAIAVAQQHRLVVMHPHRQETSRALVAQIQQGVDASTTSDDVKVICYVSIGEDLRAAGLTDAQLAQDPRFRGDGTGPRVDPRGPNSDGKALSGIDPRGAPSNGGAGYASYYLDDDTVNCHGTGDAFPDRNANFGAPFVNAGDPNWFPVIDGMTLDGGDGVAGLREVLTTNYGRGLGCDGVFLDTFDTAAPNGYTSCASANPSKFEWTAPGFSDFVRRVRAAYPGKVIVQNRGLFFLDPRHPHYQFTTRGAIDYVLYESYRLDSSSAHLWDPYFYPDNRFNVAPKLLAEAGRADGFQVLSLGYAEGPSDLMSRATLTGGSSLGYDDLIEDIRVTQTLIGFRHYLTSGPVTLVNTFVRDHSTTADTAPPVWTSSYNDHNPGYPTAPGEPSPRPGVRQVIAGAGMLTVRWDVAADASPVGYAIYYKAGSFDFAADPRLTSATRIEVAGTMPPNYPGWGGTTIYANQATIGGLTPGTSYAIVVRAFDRSPARNEEQNQVVLTGVPTP